MRRILSYLFMAAMLLISCGKAPEKAVPIGYKGDSVWQKTQWDSCFREFQKYMDPAVREKEMRTLDAAYIAIMKAGEQEEDSYVINFTTDGDPCEARVQRSGNKADVSVLRKGTVVGVFSMDDTIFTGEATGIKFSANPLSVNSTEVHVSATFSSGDVTLATFEANGPLELVEVSADLPEGISFRGNIEARRLWDTVRAIADEDTEDKVTPLVEEAAGAIHVNVYYEGDLSTPHARVSMRPLHIFSRYDDYWTWDVIILTEGGYILDNAWNGLGSLDDASASFVQAWQKLMPHILG